MAINVKNGNGKLSIGRLIAVVAAAIVIFGAVFSAGNTLSSINSKLDRNCRLIVELDTDTRILVAIQAEETESKEVRNLAREITSQSAPESC